MKIDYLTWPDWPHNRTAIVAEVGVNHGGNEGLAWEMIQSANENGADFVKLQSFVMESFFHPSLSYYSNTKSLELSFEVQRRLFSKAKNEGINLITTPYDFDSVDMVEEFNPPAHKIASMDNDNIPLIRYIAEKGRPVLVSCGMADLDEIQSVVNIIKRAGNNKLVLLHCISDYPTRDEDMNLAAINLLKRMFDLPVGLSDHSLGLTGSYIAASLGATVIEKHFTIDRSLVKKIPDADHDISIEPSELKELNRFCESVNVMLGCERRKLTENEIAGRKNLRRGLYARRNIKAGEKLTLENTVLLRPVKGISANQWDKMVGKKYVSNIKKHKPIYMSDLI